MMYRCCLALAAAASLLGASAALAQNADTVDLLHASATPVANRLLALDGSSHFPSSVWEVPFALNGNTSSAVFKAFNYSSAANSSGICGYSFGASGFTRGVVGATESVNGKGVYGVAKATTGLSSGVYGENSSDWGYGVYGYSSHASGFTHGVMGLIQSTGGRAVEGCADAYSGGCTGVYGQSNSTSGYGIVGSAEAVSGTNYGVYGYTCSPNGYGVYSNGDLQCAGRLHRVGRQDRVRD